MGTDTQDQSNPVSSAMRTYAYDAASNRAQVTEAGVTSNYVPNNLNQYSTVDVGGAPQNFSYDEDGNATELPLAGIGYSLTYDAENRLTSITPSDPAPGDQRLTFVYDYLGRRASKAASVYDGSGWGTPVKTQYWYSGWTLIAETTEDGTPISYHVWGKDLGQGIETAGGIGGLLTSVDASGGQLFYTYDASGNVSEVLDELGNVAAHYEYDPYGELLSSTGPLAEENPFRYSTKYWDQETGLYYFGYRYYSPEWGRFINRDPLGESGGANLYAYASNNPSNAVDPLGLKTAKMYNGQMVWVPDETDGALINNALTRAGFISDALDAECIPSAERAKLEQAKQDLEDYAQDVLDFEPWQRVREGTQWSFNLDPIDPPYIPSTMDKFERFLLTTSPVEMVAGAALAIGVTVAATAATAVTGGTIGFIAGAVLEVAAAGIIEHGLPAGVNRSFEAASMAALPIGGVIALGKLAKASAGAARLAYRTARNAEAVAAKLGKGVGRLRPTTGTGCFVAATLIATAAHGALPIEEVEVGERVYPTTETCESTDYSDWQEIDLKKTDGDGEEYETRVKLLRAPEWVSAKGVTPGGSVYLELKELNLAGTFQVTAVSEEPAIEEGPGCPVTATMTRVARDVISLELSDGKRLDVTKAHPLFSATRRAWVPAAQLLRGEELKTRGDPVQVSALYLTPHAPTRVYNLEVDGAHRYFVGEGEVLAHNTCPGELGGFQPVVLRRGTLRRLEPQGTISTHSPVPAGYRVSNSRRTHILEGDPVGTGHGPGRGYSDAFPDTWTDEQAIAAIERVANRPKSTWKQSTGPGFRGGPVSKGGPAPGSPKLNNQNRPVRFTVRGNDHGQSIEVIIEPDGAGIITGYPR